MIGGRGHLPAPQSFAVRLRRMKISVCAKFARTARGGKRIIFSQIPDVGKLRKILPDSRLRHSPVPFIPQAEHRPCFCRKSVFGSDAAPASAIFPASGKSLKIPRSAILPVRSPLFNLCIFCTGCPRDTPRKDGRNRQTYNPSISSAPPKSHL